jgi:hypothetical protein
MNGKRMLERDGDITVEILPSAETTPTLMDMSPEQCIVWRLGEFHQRVRRAVADWAGVAAQNVLPHTQLGQLMPWNLGSQGNLVQSVNVHEVFAPAFPNTHMLPLSQLLSPATTVAQWEKLVWQRQFPPTPCLPFTD